MIRLTEGEAAAMSVMDLLAAQNEAYDRVQHLEKQDERVRKNAQRLVVQNRSLTETCKNYMEKYDTLIAFIWRTIGNGEDGNTPIEKLIQDFSDEKRKFLDELHQRDYVKDLVWANEEIEKLATLEKLAEIGERAADVRVSTDGLHVNWPAAVAAILRAAKPRVDVAPGHHAVSGNCSTLTLNKADIDWLNSRIVYGVQLPEIAPQSVSNFLTQSNRAAQMFKEAKNDLFKTAYGGKSTFGLTRAEAEENIFLEQIPGKDMTVGACVTLLESTRKNLDRATRALVRAGFQDLGGEEWKPPISPEPHTGPTRAEAEAKLKEVNAKECYYVSVDHAWKWLLPQLPGERAEMPKLITIEDAYYAEPDRTMEPIEFTLNYLRPWLHTPTGWELDVTAEEIHDTCTTRLDGYQAVVDLCRSRIRPTFECAECAKKDTRIEMYDRQQNMMAKTIEIQRSALERAASAAKSALEGE